MASLTITRGLPGSGKSRWANETRYHNDNTVVVNRDESRQCLFGSADQDYYAVDPAVLRRRENLITAVNHAKIKDALRAGFDVIVSDTNLRVRVCRELRALALREGAEFLVQDFSDVPLDVCLTRNSYRLDKEPLPEKVIRDMYNRYIRGGLAPIPDADTDDLGRVGDYGVEPVVRDSSLPPAFIFDIDGTLAIHGERSPYDFSRVSEDMPNEDVADMSVALYCSEGALYEDVRIIVMSGRSDECRDATEAWLRNNGIVYHELYMRPEDDKRQDWQVKYDLFNKHIRGRFDVRGVFDDRDQVVKLWREMGLTCFQVNYGDF